MKNFIKYFSLFLLTIFSFYYTDKISNLIIYNSSLMNEINNNKDKYFSNYVDAIITSNTIIPGLNGKKVLELESYYQMNGDFNQSKLVFSEIKPSISLQDNKDLVIIKGNSYKRSVSIITNNNKIITYSNKNNIKINNHNNICVNEENKKCEYKVKSSVNIKDNIIGDISSGDIIFIDNNVSVNSFKYLLKKIRYQDLDIIYLNDLISEKW